MRRGDLVTIALSGDLSEPRPALIIQSDQFTDTGTVTVLLFSGTQVNAPLLRLTVNPTSENNLSKPSQIMVDKAMTVRREKIGKPFGHLEDTLMMSVTRLLALFLGFA